MTWHPQVFRHRRVDKEEYAVHEAFFATDGAMRGFTAEAVSPRYPSVEELRSALEELHAKLDEKAAIPLGDRQFLHSKADVALWLQHIHDPVRDFDENNAS
jgi:hypothetical protein